MADPIGNRPHRVNLDGKSCTELGTSAVAIMPGSYIYKKDDGTFAYPDTKRPGAFVAMCDDKVGGSIIQPIPIGDSVTGDQAEQGRVYAMLAPAGSVLHANATLFKYNDTAKDGSLSLATGPDDDVVAIAIESYTVPATPAKSHVKVRLV